MCAHQDKKNTLKATSRLDKADPPDSQAPALEYGLRRSL